jgi:1-acyl-sn-glycerol-3-phosphate acyltransferase
MRRVLRRFSGGRFDTGSNGEAVRAGIVLGMLAGPAAWMVRRRGGDSVAERNWARRAVSLLDIRISSVGLHHVDPHEQYIVAPLHEGFLDVPVLLELPLDMTFAVRQELAGLAILGPHLKRSRHVLVDPESPVQAYRRLLAAAPGVFAAGQSLVVFPQGSILGIETAFQQGAFRLAEWFRRPLLPVVIAGTHRVWEHPFSPRIRFGCEVRLEVLSPIPAHDAVAKMGALQREMKARALAGGPTPRRYVPERDGLWQGYRFGIDPAFASTVSARRISASA